MPIAMRVWLQDGPPVTISPSGEIKSPFPFHELAGQCGLCHGPQIVICGIVQCAACPAVNQWLQESRQHLARIKSGFKLEVL